MVADVIAGDVPGSGFSLVALLLPPLEKDMGSGGRGQVGLPHLSRGKHRVRNAT